MGWSIGFDSNWNRDIGYGVPAECDHSRCKKQIDRGLPYVCGSEPYGGEYGCGLYFCSQHLIYCQPRGSDNAISRCTKCFAYKEPFKPKPDVREWLEWKLKDESWNKWREANPEEVEKIKEQLCQNQSN